MPDFLAFSNLKEMRGVKALWLDLDDTLYDHTHAVRCGLDAVRQRFSCFSRVPTNELAILYNRALNTFHTNFLRGEIDFAELRRRKYKLFCETATADEKSVPPIYDFHRIYDKAYGQNRRATPGSVEMLNSLRQSGTNLAVITNGKQDTQEEKLRIIGLDWLIPNLHTSERLGITKPDPLIYRRALETTGQPAKDLLMVGDSVENDVQAGLAAGLNVALYAPGRSEHVLPTDDRDVPVIHQWTDLLELLKQETVLSCG